MIALVPVGLYAALVKPSPAAAGKVVDGLNIVPPASKEGKAWPICRSAVWPEQGKKIRLLNLRRIPLKGFKSVIVGLTQIFDGNGCIHKRFYSDMPCATSGASDVWRDDLVVSSKRLITTRNRSQAYEIKSPTITGLKKLSDNKS